MRVVGECDYGSLLRPVKKGKLCTSEIVRINVLVQFKDQDELRINAQRSPSLDGPLWQEGRTWLAALELPDDERQSVDACLRHIDFLDKELRLVDRDVAVHALASEEIRRLMTIPGISVTTAATFMAAIGDIRPFPSPRHLVGYLGLDSKVRQSGSSPAKLGSTSKQGAKEARNMLVEAAWSAASRTSEGFR